jgi:hypothetical protein
MNISRAWAMPDSSTFSIAPINLLIERYIREYEKIIDPFVYNSPFKKRSISNDIDPDIEADYHMDALDFIKIFKNNEVDVVLFDPPYSPRQVSECYKKLNKTVNMQTTQSSFWGNLKQEIARILSSKGICITCGWNSGGIGKTLGFDIKEILLVAHGGWHNDTIVTVEGRRC